MKTESQQLHPASTSLEEILQTHGVIGHAMIR